MILYGGSNCNSELDINSVKSLCLGVLEKSRLWISDCNVARRLLEPRLKGVNDTAGVVPKSTNKQPLFAQVCRLTQRHRFALKGILRRLGIRSLSDGGAQKGPPRLPCCLSTAREKNANSFSTSGLRLSSLPTCVLLLDQLVLRSF